MTANYKNFLIKLPKSLRIFLMDRDILNAYLKNTLSFLKNHPGHESTLMNIIRESPRSIISQSFTWMDTLEGDSYWLELDAKWKKEAAKLILYDKTNLISSEL